MDNTVRFIFIHDFREVNKQLVMKPFTIPKISPVLQELDGFTFATALDLNMCYYIICLDPDAIKICTIIFPWGKYSLPYQLGKGEVVNHLIESMVMG